MSRKSKDSCWFASLFYFAHIQLHEQAPLAYVRFISYSNYFPAKNNNVLTLRKKGGKRRHGNRGARLKFDQSETSVFYLELWVVQYFSRRSQITRLIFILCGFYRSRNFRFTASQLVVNLTWMVQGSPTFFSYFLKMKVAEIYAIIKSLK